MAAMKVVARFRDGRVVKGTTQNFNPSAAGFHLFPWDPLTDKVSTNPGQAVVVPFAELKAMFVVKDYRGNADHVEAPSFDAGPPASHVGAKLRVTFADGETLLGRSMNVDLNSTGFFLVPADPGSNNQRVFVVNAAVKEVKQLP